MTTSPATTSRHYAGVVTELEDGDIEEMLRAVGYVAKARGMAQVAKDAGLGRESLYKALRPGAKPQFETICKVFGAIGLRLSVESATPDHRHATA